MSRLEELVEEHNRLQPGPRRERPAGCQEVVIVEAGVYNDGEGQVRRLDPGDRLMTRNWYARELVEDGFAKWPGEAEAQEDLLQMLEALEEEAQVYEALALPAEVVQALKDRNMGTMAALRAASDRQLLAVPGIGAGRLRRIREAVGEQG